MGYGRGKKNQNLDLNALKNLRAGIDSYILGLILTDGFITKEGYLSFGFQHRDLSLLKLIKTRLKTKATIRTTKVKTKHGIKKYVWLSINNRRIGEVLAEYGIGNNKSLTIRLPKKIPKNKLRFFTIGCWDGDGSIVFNYSKNKKCYSTGVKLVSCSRGFLEDLKEALEEFNIQSSISTEMRKHQGRNDMYTLRILSESYIAFYKFLYKDIKFTPLLRKKIKFQQLIKRISVRKNSLNVQSRGAEYTKRLSKKFLTHHYIKQKKSLRKIAKMVNCDTSVVKKRLQLYGLHR